jgi:hypothetical protein
MAYMTQDGSIIDRAGKVIFFSTQRFVDDICLGNCCFICGARPEDKPFNNEHILPEWLLRRYDLFLRTITLPNDRTVRYDRYTVPCCVDCNTLMGRVIEEPISQVVQAGTEAVINYIQSGDGALKIFIWMGLIFLKVHLKDRTFRVDPDLRKQPEQIGDRYDWDNLHHLHSLVRSFYTGCRVEREALGSCLAVPVRIQVSQEKFDFGDLSFAQTMLLRLDETALLTVFNDSGAVNGWFWQKLEQITGPLSDLQLREILVEFAYLNLHLKERPTFQTECNSLTETCRIVGHRGSPDLDPMDRRVRGKLLHHVFRDILPCTRNRHATNEEVLEAVKAGNFSFLFDKDGNFIETDKNYT